MRQGVKNYSNMGHSLVLKSTCDIVENKRQGHATLPFLKFDMRHWGPPIKGPIIVCSLLWSFKNYLEVYSVSMSFSCRVFVHEDFVCLNVPTYADWLC